MNQLAYLRRWLPGCVRTGSRAEAIAGLSLILNTVRSTVLAALRDHLPEARVAHLMTLDDIADMVRRYDLGEWLLNEGFATRE